MKKFLATILTLLYFLSTTGATIHLHYCMDKLVEQSFWHSDEGQCSKCGMDKSQQEKDCCKDEHKQYKLDVDHNTATSTFDFIKLLSIAEPVSFIEIPVIAFSSITEENPNSNAPPRSSSIAIYKRNCVFRI